MGLLTLRLTNNSCATPVCDLYIHNETPNDLAKSLN